MELVDWIQIIAVALLFLVPIIYIIVRIKRPKTSKEEASIDASQIVEAFGKDNITRVTFVRNKLNVVVRDNRRVDHDALKAHGAIGINIIGDTIKLYFEGDNEAIYQNVKHIMGETV